MWGKIEPHWLQVNHVTIETGKFPKHAKPLRIVLISDAHSEARPLLEDRVLEVVRAQHPDLILFTGDATNGEAGVPVFRKLMRDMAAIAPTFVVLQAKCPAMQLNIHGLPLAITGLDDTSSATISSLYRGVPENEFMIFMNHGPERIIEVSDYGVDLYCAGHIHGGQITLPFYGAIYTESDFGKKNEWGLHKVEHTYLYVNRGLGMTGGVVPRLRFFARPEVTVIDVVPDE